MAKNDGAGCGAILVLGLIVFAIGRCSGGGDDSPAPNPVDGATALAELAPEPLRAISHRYVQSASLNCRASPSTSGERIESLGRGAYVGVVETRNGWSLLDRSPPCWVSSSYLDPSPPPAEVRSLYSGSGSTGGRRSGNSSARTYGGAFANCSAARAAGADPVYAGDPGYGRHLDRDGDGVGCE